MKLALGTVQFGLRYGVANTTGQPGEADVTAILRHAADVGVKVLDTACLYGDSESVLGRCLPEDHEFQIVTKTPKFSGMDAADAVMALHAAFDVSSSRLGVQRVHGLLTHDANDLLGPLGASLWQTMVSLRDEGRVRRIGASIYSGAQIDALLARYPLELIQLPLSLLDQRLLQGGQMDRLHERGVEIHARSVFLQGALLMRPDRLPSHLEGLRPHLAEIARRAAAIGISPLQAALRFVASLPQVTAVVCGVDSPRHFDELAAALTPPLPVLDAAGAAACAFSDTQLLDPSQWRYA